MTTTDWSQYQDVLNPTFYGYLPHESAASRIRAYHPRVIHGLLQTEAYARTLNQETSRRPDRDRSPETVAKQLRARLGRQSVLDRVEAHFVFDEAVLWRARGENFSVELLDEQLQRLHEVADRGVTIEYIPRRQSETAAMTQGSFNLLDVADRRVMYLERGDDSSVVDDPEQIERYTAAFDQLAELAVDIRDFTYA